MEEWTPVLIASLKMEAICSSKTSVDFQRTTWRYIPEDSTLHNHPCENLKSYNFRVVYKETAGWVPVLLMAKVWRQGETGSTTEVPQDPAVRTDKHFERRNGDQISDYVRNMKKLLTT
jgi:hypothetical protein